MVMPNAATAAIAARYGWQGPAETISTACAASTHAITAAARLVETGRCQVVMAGGAEAARTPGGLAAFSKAGAVSAAKAGRPFDLNRDGFVLAEGAAALILEDLVHARARGVPVLAVILGGASTCDAYHVTAPRPDGSAAAYCAVASVMAIASRLVPPTAGHDAPDPGIRPLDVVARHPRPAPDGLVLSKLVRLRRA
jgi:3-oxoacyl-[acyl-carrier-protein] synthase II